MKVLLTYLQLKRMLEVAGHLHGCRLKIIMIVFCESVVGPALCVKHTSWTFS